MPSPAQALTGSETPRVQMRHNAAMPALPIDDALPDLNAALAAHSAAVLVAPPGAGKTTGVPLALLAATWRGDGRILIQEPRRIAARAAARRMAELLGESVGETVGYRVRLDSRVGPRTRIEVLTDGLFLRRLQDDAGLDGVACVIFDELHERSLETDLALALTRDMQAGLRPDLRIVAMSATLDPGPVSALLGDCPVVQSEGRLFPVETRWLDREPAGRIEDTTASAIRRALSEEHGSMLVFLPGVAEIRRVQARLEETALPDGVDLTPLYGDLPAAQQDHAIAPAPPGRRKVVLSTSIAETSLTIEGVRLVIDSGLARRPQFSPRTGMSRLETMRVSQASADQRRGRAGRLEPGVCWRLWTREQQRGLTPATPPEIVDADLAPLALDLAGWGVRDATALAWLTPPPGASLAQARELLHALGAIDEDTAITPEGRAMARLGLHPRLAHLLLQGRARGELRLAAVLAALLGERDLIRRSPGVATDPDLRQAVEIVLSAQSGGSPAASTVDRATLRLVLETARRLLPPAATRRPSSDSGSRSRADAAALPYDLRQLGALVAIGWPDRVGRRRANEPRYRLANGSGAVLASDHAPPEFIAIAELDGTSGDARIRRFAEITREDIESLFADRIRTHEIVAWSTRDDAVVARAERRLGALVLDERPLTQADPERVRDAMLQGIRSLGLSALPWSDAASGLRARVAFLHQRIGDPWPDMGDTALLDGLEDWLAPALDGVTRRAHLLRVDLLAALRGLLPWPLPRELDTLAPTHVVVPSGSRVPVDYASGATPVLAVRLQELFGLAETPRILRDTLPLTLHLLSPARRPVQVTSDLASFWREGYRAVKGELKGRYPKHFWPDDPLAAPPTARVRPRPSVN
jgi:ATP-dependent helicase HrpB